MAYTRLSHVGAAVPTSLTATIASGATTATIADATGWSTLGATGPFYIVIYELTGSDPDTRINEEKIQVTSISGTGLSGMTRGVDGTTAVSHVSGSIVEHVFTALEADEANAVAAGTLGKVVAKGDLLTGSASQTLVKTTVGADGTLPIADSTAPGGISYGLIGSANITDGSVGSVDLAANAVTAAKITPGILTEAMMSSAFWHRATFSVTSGTSGDTTIPHGASFTPTFYQIMFTAPSATPNVISGWVQRTAPNGTNVTVRISASQSGSVAGLLASGQTVTGTIISYA